MLVSINPLPLQIQKGLRSEGGRLIHTEASAPHWNEDWSLWSPCPGLIFFPFFVPSLADSSPTFGHFLSE